MNLELWRWLLYGLASPVVSGVMVGFIMKIFQGREIRKMRTKIEGLAAMLTRPSTPPPSPHNEAEDH